MAYALRVSESGTPWWTYGGRSAEATFHIRKKKRGDLGVPEVREPWQICEENSRLKRRAADPTLHNQIP